MIEIKRTCGAETPHKIPQISSLTNSSWTRRRFQARCMSTRRRMAVCSQAMRNRSEREPAHEEAVNCRGGASPHAPTRSASVGRTERSGHRYRKTASTAKRRLDRKVWRAGSDRRGRSEPTWKERQTRVGLVGAQDVTLCEDDLCTSFPCGETSERRRAARPAYDCADHP